MSSIQKSVKATNNTIDNVGLPKDFDKAIIEYIWNGFDAGATTVEINFEITDTLGSIDNFSIIDNGKGIEYETIELSFSPILDSQKKYNNTSFYTRGKHGKGRFAFDCFSSSVLWNTTYAKGENNYNYKISINSSNKNNYTILEEPILTKNNTGTIVTFKGLHEINGTYLSSNVLKGFLKYHYAWFLHLHRSQNFKILINGENLIYDDIINKFDEINLPVIVKNKGLDKKFNFQLYYIERKGKIGEDSQNYYLNDEKRPVWNVDNRTNNKGDNFYNSLYVVSNYFNGFVVTEKKDTPLTGYSKFDDIFKELIKKLDEYLLEKKREFLKSNSHKLIEKLNQEGVMPKFGGSKYEKIKQEDFEDVVKEIYIFEPRIFEQSTNKQQKKTILEFLKLLLEDDKREQILEVMKNIIDLTDKQIKEFSSILQKTKLTNIMKMVNYLLGRKKTILQLKTLVYDLKKYTNERDHIQKVIEKNYWLFGEQYHLCTADKNLEKVLIKYFNEIDVKNGKLELDDNQKLKRPDIFMIRKLSVNNGNSKTFNDNIIVELKRPSVILNKEIYQQIESYMDAIQENQEFNSDLRRWKFIMISNEKDRYIKQLENDNKIYQQPFLVRKSENYEIFAMTWDDVFVSFDIVYQNIVDALDIDDEELKKDLKIESVEKSKTSSKKIVNDILN